MTDKDLIIKNNPSDMFVLVNKHKKINYDYYTN